MSLNIFQTLTQYGGKWSIKSRRAFTEEEKSCINAAVVVPTDYGKSVCFTMINGANTYIPLSTMSSLNVGDNFDVNTGELLVLSKEGEKDTLRVE